MSETRTLTRLPATFELGGWKGRGTVENIGRDGLFIGTSTLPTRGEKVWLEISAGADEPVCATGIVWWTTVDRGREPGGRVGFGVRLVGAGRSWRRLLRRSR